MITSLKRIKSFLGRQDRSSSGARTADIALSAVPAIGGAGSDRDTAALERLDTDIARTGQTDASFSDITLRLIETKRILHTFKERKKKTVYISQRIFHEDLRLNNDTDFSVDCFDKNKLLADSSPLALRQFDNSIIIVVSGDAVDPSSVDLLRRIKESCRDTLLIAWLWDNHHLISRSISLSKICDVVYPAHSDNLQLIDRFCPMVKAPLPACIFAWSKDEARSLGANTLLQDRPYDVSGCFIGYEQFVHRNLVFDEVKSQFPDQHLERRGWSSYDSLTPSEKWDDWCMSKTNIVIPVLSDTPIRLFDALLTGNIPIVPLRLRRNFSSADLALLDDLSVEWYDHCDVLNMSRIVDHAVSSFDRYPQKILARHQYALKNHMTADRVKYILGDIAEE